MAGTALKAALTPLCGPGTSAKGISSQITAVRTVLLFKVSVTNTIFISQMFLPAFLLVLFR